jgi:hypothetical protein
MDFSRRLCLFFSGGRARLAAGLGAGGRLRVEWQDSISINPSLPLPKFLLFGTPGSPFSFCLAVVAVCRWVEILTKKLAQIQTDDARSTNFFWWCLVNLRLEILRLFDLAEIPQHKNQIYPVMHHKHVYKKCQINISAVYNPSSGVSHRQLCYHSCSQGSRPEPSHATQIFLDVYKDKHCSCRMVQRGPLRVYLSNSI